MMFHTTLRRWIQGSLVVSSLWTVSSFQTNHKNHDVFRKHVGGTKDNGVRSLFVPSSSSSSSLSSSLPLFGFSKAIPTTTTTSSTSSLRAAAKSTLLEEALELKAQAERMRLEAEQQDSTLTLTKIQELETKLGNKKWLEKHPDQEELLMKQLDALQDRLVKGTAGSSSSSSSSSAATISTDQKTPKDNDNSNSNSNSLVIDNNTLTDEEQQRKQAKLLEKFTIPLQGFDQKDLDLYLPVATQIDLDMPNATTQEKLEAFHASEELKDHFANKIKELFLGPIQEFQEMEYLKEEYMSSSSSVEKENLKRRMAQLETSMNEDDRFLYCESVYRELPPLTEDYIQERVDNISKLPTVLQAMYKRRSSLPEDADLRLAIELDHCEPQIQLLEQVPNLRPLSPEQRQDAVKAFDSLSMGARANFAKELGIQPNEKGEYETEQVITKLVGSSDNLQDKPLQELMNAANAAADSKDFDNDIEVIDRSRWIFELIPASGRLETFQPTDEDMDTLYSQVFGKKTFAPSSKPERVGGGYYVRGVNRCGEEDTANDDCMAALQEKMIETGLSERLQLHYLLDPSPATDEEIETGDDLRPLLYVTANDPSIMYNPAKPLTKGLVTASALFSTLLFGIGSCGLNSELMDQLQTTVEAGGSDLSMITDPAFTIAMSIVGIQVAHEVAHGVIAFRDKIKLGVPNLIPSIQLGLTGAITSFQSPPKNFKSLFDFALAGPLAGFTVSLILLSTGLGLTSSIDLAQQSQLPVLPIELLRSSTLIGGMVETTLGRGALLSPTPETALLPLHPLAIAGVAGLYSNALALLPLGHTDGGRIATAMFGRRGAYLVKSFTTLLLAAIGLFGLDNSNLFLLYILFASIWQRELDAPAYNEVDELDVTRGLIAIATLVVVAVTLVPVL